MATFGQVLVTGLVGFGVFKIAQDTFDTVYPGRRVPRQVTIAKAKDQGCICPHCDKRTALKDFQGDHIWPLCEGGKNSWNNIQALCRWCNARKGGRCGLIERLSGLSG